MRLAAAFFLAIGLVAAQAAHGGLLAPFLAYPAYGFLAIGLLLAMPQAFSPGAGRKVWIFPLAAGIALTGYALWRCDKGPDPALATIDIALILGCAGMWLGTALALTRNNARFLFLNICLAAACVQAVVAVVQLLLAGDFSEPYWLSQQLQNFYAARFAYRPRGFFMNPNQFAWLMNAMAFMALSLGIWGRVRVIWRIGLLYLAAVFGVMTVLSASRAGMVSLAAGFSVFLLLSLAAVLVSVTQRRMLFLGVGSALLAVCAGATYAAFTTSWIAQSRLDALLNFEVRELLAEQAVRLFQMEPLLGAGPGIYRYAARMLRTGEITGDPIYAHNDWLQFPAEYGVIGFALLVILVAAALVCGACGFLALVRVAFTETGNALSSSAAFVLGATCALVAGAFHSSADFNMHVPANALLAAALLGLVTGARPAGSDRESRFHPSAMAAVVAALMAAYGLGALLFKRGVAEYQTLRAENLMLNGEVKLALAEADKGLAALPGDPALLALRARGLYEYESWLQVVTPGEIVDVPEEDEYSDEGDAGDTEGEDVIFNEESIVLLSEEESQKFYGDSAAIYEGLTKVQPLNREHRIGHARALGALGLGERARGEYVEAIRLDPWHAYAWANYGDFLADAEDTARARQIFMIGAGLPSGAYSWSQVESIDEDIQFEKELEEEESE